MNQSHTGDDGARPSHKRRSPAQARSRNTVDCIKQAALALGRESSFDAVTTARIAERAGVSIGSLYQYFTSRESIMLGIYEDVSLDLMLETRRLSETLVEEDLRSSVERIVEQILRLHEVHKLVLIDMPRQFPELALTTHPSGYDGMIRASIKAFVAGRGAPGARAELETTVFFLERVVMDSIRTWLREQPAHPARSALIAGIVDLVLATLRAAL